jgi:hypothetical protein
MSNHKETVDVFSNPHNYKLLGRYKGILKKIETIRNEITILKRLTNDKHKSAKSTTEKNKILEDFKVQIQRIQNNNIIKTEYRALCEKRNNIEITILNKMNGIVQHKVKTKKDKENIKHKINKPIFVNTESEKVNDLSNMINKYKCFASSNTAKFSTISAENTKYKKNVNKINKLHHQKTNIDINTDADKNQMEHLHNLISTLKQKI